MKKFSVSKRSYCPHCHTVFQESNDELIPMFPKNIPENIIEDYNEAVVSLSTPKASAAFARRCLKNLLKEISNCEVATLSASAKEAKKHLTPHGILICEVGYNQERLEKLFPDLPFFWVEFKKPGMGVFMLTRDELSS